MLREPEHKFLNKQGYIHLSSSNCSTCKIMLDIHCKIIIINERYSTLYVKVAVLHGFYESQPATF